MLRVRWIGEVAYREVLALQTALFEYGKEQHLLLLEHPHVFTYGPRSDLEKNLLCNPAEVGADFVSVKRGGDITYHGPGQLVGYPILNLKNAVGAKDHVFDVEQLVIDTLTELGVKNAGRLPGFAGVWLDADNDQRRKISAVGVRLARGRTMHGFALNIASPLQQQFGALPVLWRAEIVAVVMLAPLGVYSTLNNDRPFEWIALAAVLALGVLGTAVAHYAMVMLAGRLGSTRAAASLYLMPAVSLALGVFVNDENVAPLAIAGSVVAVLGAYVLSRSRRTLA